MVNNLVRRVTHVFDVAGSSRRPSTWNPKDNVKADLLEVSDRRIRYKGAGAGGGTDSDAAAVRSDQPIPTECGVYYFEVEVINQGRDGFIGVGLCTGSVNLGRLPGWEQHSYGYHGDDGQRFQGSGKGMPFGPKYGAGDVVGCCLDMTASTVSYYVNGVEIGVAFENVRETELFPTVGLNTPGEEVVVNFGQDPFKVDVSELLRKAKQRSMQQIERTPVPNMQGAGLKLALDYLLHHGYPDTAAAVGKDLEDWIGACESANSSASNKQVPTASTIVEQLDSARRRAAIRQMVMEGKIEEASRAAEAYVPGVFAEQPSIQFQMHCQQLVESVRERHNHNVERAGSAGGDDDDTLALMQAVSESARDASQQETLQEVLSLLVFNDPANSPLGYLMTTDRRVELAESLNKAMLAQKGESHTSALDLIHRQAVVSLEWGLQEHIGTVSLVEAQDAFRDRIEVFSYPTFDT
eukprot:CAMPEP_0114252164 /NCGR_PEP_ID=MMETSP0058-20121206/15685_1 /TAXON_ID=36894 /ORGANISM="Pyramimonas parkeae, CCMP726" /LENGTH=465 /DNA_ID=CAMNT_0001366069 /DNA_START=120 /DNA_END=1517 /DNA_ORIENTATION=+